MFVHRILRLLGMWLARNYGPRPRPPLALEVTPGNDRLEAIGDRLRHLTEVVEAFARKTIELREEADRQGDRNFRSTRRLTGITVSVAVVAAVFGGYQSVISHDALQEAQFEQRAWMQGSIESASISWHPSSPGSSQLNLYITAPLVVSNLGHLPAFAVHSTLLIGLEGNGAPPLDFSKKYTSCDPGPKAGLVLSTQVVFPNVHWGVNNFGGVILPVVFSRQIGMPPGVQPGTFLGGTTLRPFLQGCVTYRTSTDKLVHHTIFTYALNLAQNVGAPDGSLLAGEDIPASKLSLVEATDLDAAD